ncbi:hypothetical protein ACODM8_13665 [Vibrio ostreicida]|uniref:hypothetical protein n=1 Tax=Vibrio ostreicida TaxID=526588 RepID=UPI003B5CF138
MFLYEETHTLAVESLDNGSMEFLVEDGKLSSTGIIEHGAPTKVLLHVSAAMNGC